MGDGERRVPMKGIIAPETTDKKLVQRVLAAGKFFRTSAGDVYFAPKDGVVVKVGSAAFATFVADTCKLSRAARDFKQRVADIADAGRRKSELVCIEHCSSYDPIRKRFLVNLGVGKILAISSKRVQGVRNGEGGVLFTDEPDFTPLNPEEVMRHATAPRKAAEIFVRDVLDFPQLAGDGFTVKEANSLGIAYWVGVFLPRQLVRAKPVLVWIGPAGSGKTVCGRKALRAHYGGSIDVSGSAELGRGLKDLAASISARTFVVRDDLNQAPDGLIDLVNRVSTGGAFDLAKFHSTLEQERFEMRGSLAVTATTPRWVKREDLLTRLIPIRVVPSTRTKETEEERLQRADRARAAAWGLAIYALQTILKSEEKPIPITRFESWERGVRAVAQALGFHDALVEALKKLKQQTVILATASDPLLALLRQVVEGARGGVWTGSAADLNDALATAAGILQPDDDHVLRPRSVMELSRQLDQLERDGGGVVRVERTGKAHGNVVAWRITLLDNGVGAVGVTGVRGAEVSSSKEKKKEKKVGRQAPRHPQHPRQKAKGSRQDNAARGGEILFRPVNFTP